MKSLEYRFWTDICPTLNSTLSYQSSYKIAFITRTYSHNDLLDFLFHVMEISSRQVAWVILDIALPVKLLNIWTLHQICYEEFIDLTQNFLLQFPKQGLRIFKRERMRGKSVGW